MAYSELNDPAKAYTLESFIALKYQDDLTYRNFSILEVIDGIELTDHCVIDEYLEELNSICVDVELTPEEFARYKYSPDLMAYDVYGTTQVDFIILMANDMVDPKEFNLKKIRLPYASAFREFLSSVYNANGGYIEQNREDNGLMVY